MLYKFEPTYKQILAPLNKKSSVTKYEAFFINTKYKKYPHFHTSHATKVLVANLSHS